MHIALYGALALASMQQNKFLRHGAGTKRMISASELEVSLRQSLQGVMGSGTWAHRSEEIESKMWVTFQSLPKNEHGRLSPKAVRFIVHNYFAREHGWLIEGLEPSGTRANVSEVHGASIIQSKAPALLEALLEDKQHNRGLALNDAVAMAATLEHLIFDEAIVLLERAYALNGLNTGDMLDEIGLHEVLRSYLLLFGEGSAADLYDGELHRSIKARYSTEAGWFEIVAYEQDVQHDYDYNRRFTANPFVERKYSFEQASAMVVNLAEGYGKWQNADCRDMKEYLMKLDQKGTGRIPLDVFYRAPFFYKTDAGSAYEFTESREYLRDVGALDESLRSNPGVVIANYLVGPSNCIATNNYYSVCCMNECEAIMNEIEGHIKGAEATPQQLLALIANMPSSTVEAPRNFTDDLMSRLELIAASNEGTIPLHGRLFAQWLHYAFPYECPMPTNTVSGTAASAWLNGAAIGSAEEREEHIKAADDLDVAGEPSTGQWSDEEILPFAETQQRSRFSSLMKLVLMAAGLVFVLKEGYSSFSVAMSSRMGKDLKYIKKDIRKDMLDMKCALPI